VNQVNPKTKTEWRWWLIWVGASVLVIASIVWMRPRNTRTVTFRFADAGIRDPVTNVVVTLVHWRRTVYPHWLVRIFPKLPQLAVDEERRVVCVSDTVVFSGIPISFDGAYAFEFKNENYQSTKRMFVNSQPEGRYLIHVYGYGRLSSQNEPWKDPVIERLRDLPPTTNFVMVWLQRGQ
jgi:hypothetical protein